MNKPDEVEVVGLRDQIEQLEDLLHDALDYLQHKPICARLLTKKDCDCGLVELMTRVHAELDENGDEDYDEDED